MKLLVGCPVSHREWILPTWLDYLHAAADRAGMEVELLCILAEDDEKSIDILDKAGANLVIVGAEDRADQRKWNASRYRHMVSLRNNLLNQVRSRQPFFFLSLDSDILLHESSIEGMFEVLQTYPDTWAVGSRCYLSSLDRMHPNMAMWRHGRSTRRFTRHDVDKIVKVDVLMAIKLMTPKAYNIDYAEHRYGEDFGWSENALNLGAEFYWDGRYISKHVMKKENLDKIDVRVGF